MTVMNTIIMMIHSHSYAAVAGVGVLSPSEKNEGGHAVWPIILGHSVAIIHHTVLIVICTQQANMHSVTSDTLGNATNSGPQCC